MRTKTIFMAWAVVAVIAWLTTVFTGNKVTEPTCWAWELSSMSGDVMLCLPTCTKEYSEANFTEPVVAICNKEIVENSDEWNNLQKELDLYTAEIKAKQWNIKAVNEKLREIRDDKANELNKKIMEDKVAFPKESQTP